MVDGSQFGINPGGYYSSLYARASLQSDTLVPWTGDDCVPGMESSTLPDLAPTPFEDIVQLSVDGSTASSRRQTNRTANPVPELWASAPRFYDLPPAAAAMERTLPVGLLSASERLALRRVAARLDVLAERLTLSRSTAEGQQIARRTVTPDVLQNCLSGYPDYLKTNKPYLIYVLEDRLQDLMVMLQHGELTPGRRLLSALAAATHILLSFAPVYLEYLSRTNFAQTMAQPGVENLEIQLRALRREYTNPAPLASFAQPVNIAFGGIETLAWQRAKARLLDFISDLSQDSTPKNVSLALQRAGVPEDCICIDNLSEIYEELPGLRDMVKSRVGDDGLGFISADIATDSSHPVQFYFNTQGQETRPLPRSRVIQLFGRWACEQEGLTAACVFQEKEDGSQFSIGFESLRYHQMESLIIQTLLETFEESGLAVIDLQQWTLLATELEREMARSLERAGLQLPDSFLTPVRDGDVSERILMWAESQARDFTNLDVVHSLIGNMAYRYTPQEMADALRQLRPRGDLPALLITAGDGRELHALLPYRGKGGSQFPQIQFVTDNSLSASRGAALAARWNAADRVVSHAPTNWWENLQPGHFGWIFEQEQLESCPESKRAQALKNVVRALSPGGTAVLHFQLAQGDYFTQCQQRSGGVKTNDVEIRHGAFRIQHHFFTMDEITALLREAGIKSGQSMQVDLRQIRSLLRGSPDENGYLETAVLTITKKRI